MSLCGWSALYMKWCEDDAKFKQDMIQAYAMSDLTLLNYFLGIEVSQVKEGIFKFQKKVY